MVNTSFGFENAETAAAVKFFVELSAPLVPIHLSVAITGEDEAYEFMEAIIFGILIVL